MSKPARPLPEPEEPRLQYAALPYRRDPDLEILLISSRETRRWVVPKGWPMKRRAPPQAAAQEAFEEAGVSGEIGEESLGAYHYMKRLPDGSAWLCRVEVFPLRVAALESDWPERSERVRQWFSPQAAAEAVDEPELKAIIGAFAG